MMISNRKLMIYSNNYAKNKFRFKNNKISFTNKNRFMMNWLIKCKINNKNKI